MKGITCCAVVACLLAVLGCHAFGQTWDLTQGVAPYVPTKLVPSFYKILVVSSESLNQQSYTFGKPPQGVFTLHACLRGHLADKEVELLWDIQCSESNRVPWTSDMPVHWQQSWRDRPATPEWAATPMSGPASGQKIIVFAKETGRPLSLDTKAAQGRGVIELIRQIYRRADETKKVPPYFKVCAVFVDSEANRQTIATYAGPTDSAPWLRRLLFSAIWLSTPVCLALLCLGLGKSLQRRRVCWPVLWSIAVLSLVVWGVYEDGIVTGGIRLDLLIILPLLAVNIVLALISGGLFMKSACRKQQSIPPSIRGS